MADNRAAQALRQIFRDRSQVEVAHLTKISQSHLSRLASGQKVANSRRDALALERVLGIALSWWDEPPQAEEYRHAQ